MDYGILLEDGLITGGDLNLTLSSREICGEHARLDLLANYFSSLFTYVGLVDIHPRHLSPTWRNERLGEDGILKRLDRFLYQREFLGEFGKI